MILLANALRLAMAERGAADPITQLIERCPRWPSFLPILTYVIFFYLHALFIFLLILPLYFHLFFIREKTELMVVRICASKVTERVRPHWNPFQFNMGNLRRPRDEVKSPGIDLGSSCMYLI